MIDYVDIDTAADELGRKFMYDSLPPVPTDEEKAVSCRGDGDYLSGGKVYNRYGFLSIITFLYFSILLL